MYKVAKGGAITINSFLNENDRNIARDYIIKTASINMREAAKIGLQSLYADPKEVLEKYKDFDIVKEMQARKGAKLLWVRARAIDADVVNANGDLFSKEELLKEIDIKGEKIPVYKSFEGVPIYTNHKNDDIEQAKGMVVYAEWNEEENCVYCTFFVDEEAYPDIARNIRTGVIHDVSMGASVEWGVCSICSNKAYTEKDYCEHLKKYKGKLYPESGKRVYEKNYGVKFIELSCVGDGAFESCEIQEIYDVDDVLSHATDIEKKASEIVSSIVLAHQGCPSEPNQRKQYEECLRVAQSTASTATRLAQVAGTLVGGPLLAGQGANQNSTVAAVLQALGIDPRSGLNVLDLINLSLNFLEVAVMNMFARKDNVDLGHVGKITKCMADLQGTMQDMIDDGVDVGSGQAPQQINQQQQQQQQQPQALQPQQAQVGLADYSPSNNNIGKIMDLSNFAESANPVGGGVALASSNINLVWASKDGKREVFASTSKSKNHFLDLAQNLLSFKENLNGTADINNSIQNVMRVANERNKNIKTNKPLEARSTNQMDHFAKIASEQRKKLAAAVTIDFKVEDNAGNRVVLSTDGTITGYTNGKKTSWEPILNESQLSSLENGHGTRVAADLLKDYGTFVKTALLDVKHRDGSRQEQLDEVRTGEGYGEKSLYDELKAQHKGISNMTRGEEVATKHLGTDEKVREELLANAGLYGHKAKHDEVTKSLAQLVDEVCMGVPTEILEIQLEECRVNGKASAHEVMSSTIKALAKSVVTAKETPSYIMRVAQMLSEEANLPEMIGAASSTVDMDAQNADKASFFNDMKESPDAVISVLKELGAAVTSDIKAMDLAEALSIAVEEGMTKEAVMALAEVMLKGQSTPEGGLDVSATPSRAEELKAALADAVEENPNIVDKLTLQATISAMGQSADEMKVTPDEIAGSIDDVPQKQLVAAINRAKTVTSTEARLRTRARREFWGIKTASSKDVTSNVIGWLADYSLHFNISSTRIATAAKRLCEQGEVAERLIEKAIAVKIKNEKTAAMNVTQSKMECLRFVCTKEDLGGMNPSDDSFEETFKQKAIEVLQQHDFTVDPATFRFTDLNVDADGNISASVSTNVTKAFNVESPSEPVDMQPENEEIPVIMSDSAKFARTNRRNQVLSKYAMAPGMGGAAMGTPGTAPASPPAGPVGDLSASPGMAAGDLGVSGFTGNEMGQSPDMDAISEPGEKAPWGSICPVCGSKDVDVAESKASCNSCSSVFEIEMMLKLVSDGTGGMGKKKDELVEEEAPLGGDTGLGAATAPPAPAMASSLKSMIRLSGTIDADVYLKTASPSFDKTAEKMLPIGMVCPSCGNRKAHKVKDNTFCYNCGNYSKTKVAACKNDPTKLEVSITWID